MDFPKLKKVKISFPLPEAPIAAPHAVVNIGEVEDKQPLAALPIKISVVGLSVYYGPFRALKDISINIPVNKITALIGPLGCGKSTLLRTLNRMNDLVQGARIEGQIYLDRKNIYDPDVDVIDIRQRIGMVFQRPNPFPMSVFDNVAYGPRLFGVRKKNILEEIVECSLRQVSVWEDVKDKLDQSAFELSIGQQQRLCIARSLAVEPDVILMDEPASDLDSISTLKIEDLLDTLKKDYTIVIVTHNMQQAARVSDFSAFMMIDEDRSGTLVEIGQTEQVFTNPKNQQTENYVTGRFG